MYRFDPYSSFYQIFVRYKMNFKQERVHSTRMPHSHYHFLCLVDPEIGVKTIIWHLN